MALAFDHAVLAVGDLDVAVGQWEHAGFTVIRGGVHPALGTHNALIAFADGTYLELLAPREAWRLRMLRVARALGLWRVVMGRRSPIARRFLGHLAQLGLVVDIALRTESVASAMLDAQARGLQVAGPFPGARQRADGREIAWRFGVPSRGDIPFLIEDVTPREWRIPHGADATHRNGATGVASIALGVRNLEASRRRYHALLGAEAIQRDGEVTYAVGAQRLVLRPAAAADAGRWAVRLRTPGGEVEVGSATPPLGPMG
jgi:glyoxalase-like protein